MKQIFTFIFTIVLAFNYSLNAQNQIVNLGFENWDALGTQNEEPVGWNSFMNAENNGVSSFVFSQAKQQKIQRSTTIRPGSTGSYSSRINSTSIIGIIANGNMTTGRIMVGSTNATDNANHNKTKTGDAAYNQPFTGNPDSLVVWVNYNGGAGQEARISATIHDNYDYIDPSGADQNAPAHVVAKAVKNYPNTNGWQRISIPFDYNHPATNAAYILITFTTNKTPGGGSGNDVVFIDDLEFKYAPEVTIAPNAIQTLVENQVGNTLTVSENFAQSGRTWKYSTFSGSGYVGFLNPETGATYTPQFANPGDYYVVCESMNNGTVVRSNQVKITVNAFSNSISPIAAQTIFQNQNGIPLNVTETPNADSREWKFSTTQGGPYQSFANVETGTSYTPLFFNINTYYVVCESTKGGVTTTSNEVEIEVLQNSTPSVSITPNGVQNLEVNVDGSILTANETITPTSREWKISSTAGGPYQSFSPIENSNTLTPNFSAAGTYFIVCESEMNGTVYTSNEVEITVVDLGVTISPDSTQHLVEYIAGDTLFALESQPADSREWKYNTQLGAPYLSFNVPETDSFFVPKFTDASYYYIICESTFNGITKTSNMVTLIVENGPNVKITPSSTQNLEEDEDGTELTVSVADYTIDSQEWKFTDSLGGTFNSFATAETNATYTPNFANEGTYYIHCEAVILGETMISNQVKVIVAEKTVGIIDYKEANFKVYSSNKSIKVDLTQTELQNALIEVFSLNGQKVNKQVLENNTINTIDLNVSEGIYFFNIINENTIYQGKLFIK